MADVPCKTCPESTDIDGVRVCKVGASRCPKLRDYQKENKGPFAPASGEIESQG